jgi:hypothetical protein
MHLGDWLAAGRLLCFPTTSAPAPRRGSLFGDRRSDAYMQPTLTLQTFATIARLPQVTVPAGEVQGAPVGISQRRAARHLVFLESTNCGAAKPLALQRSRSRGGTSGACVAPLLLISRSGGDACGP